MIRVKVVICKMNFYQLIISVFLINVEVIKCSSLALYDDIL